jgi:uncharacterized protein (TIGR03067 family)
MRIIQQSFFVGLAIVALSAALTAAIATQPATATAPASAPTTAPSTTSKPITPSDLQTIQGRWRLVRLDADGKPERPRLDDGIIVVKDDTFYDDVNGTATDPCTITLQPATSPKQITFVAQSGPDKGKSIKGIYLLEGDTLKICTYEPQDDPNQRPKEFKTDMHQTLIMLSRMP